MKAKRWLAKLQNMGYNPWTPPHAYANRRWGNPARTQHNSVLWQRAVFVTTGGLINCGNAGDFRSVAGTLTHEGKGG